jgi:hypothetical protein
MLQSQPLPRFPRLAPPLHTRKAPHRPVQLHWENMTVHKLAVSLLSCIARVHTTSSRESRDHELAFRLHQTCKSHCPRTPSLSSSLRMSLAPDSLEDDDTGSTSASKAVNIPRTTRTATATAILSGRGRFECEFRRNFRFLS